MASAAGNVRHPKGPPRTDTAPANGSAAAALVDSSVGAKVLVALTGLGLTFYVVFHMIGNLKVFQGPDALNSYAYFLKHSLGALLWIARAGLLAIFVLHVVLVVRLKLRSRRARPVPYHSARVVQATVASRTMIWTGVVVGLFTLYHLAHFTFGWLHGVNLAAVDEKGRADVYAMVVAGFKNPVVAGLYVLAQLALFAHLVHGVQSSFQTLGLKNRRTGRAIWWLGFLVALTVLVGNLAIVSGVWLGWVS
jgi:succinate dehydrogenase / fumarate reductase cytochrome b subunit